MDHWAAEATPATTHLQTSVQWDLHLKPKAFLNETCYDSNTLTTKRGRGQSASLQRWCPLTPHPVAGWVGHTLAKWLEIDYLI